MSAVFSSIANFWNNLQPQNIDFDADYTYVETISLSERVNKIALSIVNLFCLDFRRSVQFFYEAFVGQETIRASVLDINNETDTWIRKVSIDCPKHKSGFSAKHAIEFVKRGGKLTLVSKQKPLVCSKEKSFITGCSAGYNRSQVLNAFLKSQGIKVIGILSGSLSAANPARSKTREVKENANAKEQFKKVFGHSREVVIGAHLGHDPRTLFSRRKWFQDFFKQLNKPVHFAVFSESATSSIRHLLKRKGSLEGFQISYIPLKDTIGFPKWDLRTARFRPDSAQGISFFRAKLQELIKIV